MSQKSLDAVLKEHSAALMSVPGVVGVARGESGGTPCIKVYVARKTSEVLAQIPSTLHGYPVTIEQTGEIRAR